MLSATYRITWTPLVAALLVPSATSARGVDYHVSPSGRDEAEGTASAPWRSIERVNRQRFRPGDCIMFEGGAEYAGNLVLAAPGTSSSPESPITIGSSGRGRAVIRAGLGTGVLVEDLGGIVIRGLNVEGDGLGTNRGFGVLVLRRRPGEARLDHVRIEDVEARGFRWAGLYVGGVPDGLPAFRGQGGGRLGFRDVQIRGCTARGNMYHGIYVDGSGKERAVDYANRDVLVAGCVAADNPGDPRYTENHSGNGILVGDTDGAVIEGCVARNNGSDNAGRTGGPVGIWAYASNAVTIQSCESSGNRTGGRADGGGFDLDGGVTRSLIQYCYSHDNDGPGFLVWNYDGAPHPLADNVVRYNISVGDGRKHRYGGISVGTSKVPVRELLVHNNTIYTRGVPGGEPSCVRVWDRAGVGLRFVNNLFLTEGGVPAIDCEARGDGVRFAGNAYWAVDGTFLVRNGGRYDGLVAWRAATGQERWQGRDVGSYRDPLLSGFSGEVTVGSSPRPTRLEPFRPRVGSPLVDAGLDLIELSGRGPGDRDFWGIPVPRGPRFDVGAGEYDPPGR